MSYEPAAGSSVSPQQLILSLAFAAFATVRGLPAVRWRQRTAIVPPPRPPGRGSAAARDVFVMTQRRRRFGVGPSTLRSSFQVRSDTITPPLSRPFRGRSHRQPAAAAELTNTLHRRSRIIEAFKLVDNSGV